MWWPIRHPGVVAVCRLVDIESAALVLATDSALVLTRRLPLFHHHRTDWIRVEQQMLPSAHRQHEEQHIANHSNGYQ